jgi:tetratricopeptide (TPR) repeat protein
MDILVPANPYTTSELKAFFALGLNFFSMGKFDEAMIIFEALSLNGGLGIQPALAVGEILLALGRGQEAIDYFQSLKVDEEYPAETWLLLARGFLLQNDVDSARQYLAKIVELKPAGPSGVLLQAQELLRYLSP